MPSLSTKNHFASLACHLDTENPNSHVQIDQEMVLDVLKIILPKQKWRPKWERHLPSRYVIASTPGEQSLELSVEIQTTDTGQWVQVVALLDCGATGLFINSALVREKGFMTQILQ